MSRLILAPQYPTRLRYAEWMYNELPKQFEIYFDEVIVLGKFCIEFLKRSVNNDKDLGLFTSQNLSINLEFELINDYLSLDIKDDDYLLLMDLSYPGFFTNIFYHKPMRNIFAYCHATSKNTLDIYENVRYSKYPCEVAHSKLFKKIFVGSNYHKNKLGWKNIEVLGLPIPPFPVFKEEKTHDIISVVRSNKQKINYELEKKVEKNFCNITRKEVDSWEEYYKFLSSGKVLLITTKEETFGYSTLEAIMNNTIVIAPNKFSYPELLPKEFLYDDYDELESKLWSAFHGDLKCPKEILCKDLCENFYKNVVKIMKG